MRTATMRTVYLRGHLADGIGDSIDLCVSSPAEAVRLLELNFPGFVDRLKDGWYYVRRVVAGDEREIPETRLGLGFTGDLVFEPVPHVAASSQQKKGLLGAILGAVIVGAAFFLSGGALSTALPGFLGAAGATYGTIAQIGVSLALSGISTLLTPTPQTQEDVDQKRSFLFNGPVNLTQQGGPVPLIYGTMMVGTHTVSVALDTEMLSGVNAGQQRATDSTFMLRIADAVAYVDMDDLVYDPTTANLVSLNGTDITGSDTGQITAVSDLTIDYDRTNTARLLVVTLNNGVIPNEVGEYRTIPYVVRDNGIDYAGAFAVSIGFAAIPEDFSQQYSSTTPVTG